MEKNEKIGLQKMCKRYYNTCKRLHKVARNCVKEKVRNIMERVIKLPDAEAIEEFVNCSKEKGGESMNERAITIVSPVNGTAVL